MEKPWEPSDAFPRHVRICTFKDRRTRVMSRHHTNTFDMDHVCNTIHFHNTDHFSNQATYNIHVRKREYDEDYLTEMKTMMAKARRKPMMAMVAQMVTHASERHRKSARKEKRTLRQRQPRHGNWGSPTARASNSSVPVVT